MELAMASRPGRRTAVDMPSSIFGVVFKAKELF